MGIVELVGYVTDGAIICVDCVHARYKYATRADTVDGGRDRDFERWTHNNDMAVITNLDDLGPEGCYCDVCCVEIQTPYCPECGNATGTGEELCFNCRSDEEEDEGEASF